MSKFIDAVGASLREGKRATRQPFAPLKASETYITAPEFRLLNEYRMGVYWERSGFCDPKDLPMLRENGIKELRDAVYGDLRSRILALERAVYEQDNEAARSCIRDILSEVFG